VIGWYRNPPPWAGHVMVFTTDAIQVINQMSETPIPFADVTDYSIGPKLTAEGISVRTSESEVFVPMAGAHGPDGKYRDAFALFTILHLIVERRRT